ncbi:hypothetical protein CYMTET_5944 [Cymbomonas tetramitiformis]|uniref:Histone deacetylase interacting domain-containing protein n=1 Tax=Cymbomonas tetramitiformis TaxID=36881 RepID=A0AAE0GYJ1_9CHLO|nr:hypothetical protein CYMTET_5944 [Cymbomonas tetramitiformis]
MTKKRVLQDVSNRCEPEFMKRVQLRGAALPPQKVPQDDIQKAKAFLKKLENNLAPDIFKSLKSVLKRHGAEASCPERRKCVIDSVKRLFKDQLSASSDCGDVDVLDDLIYDFNSYLPDEREYLKTTREVAREYAERVRSHSEASFHVFIKLLKAHRSGGLTLVELRAKIGDLFGENEALNEDFKHFLPEAASFEAEVPASFQRARGKLKRVYNADPSQGSLSSSERPGAEVVDASADGEGHLLPTSASQTDPSQSTCEPLGPSYIRLPGSTEQRTSASGALPAGVLNDVCALRNPKYISEHPVHSSAVREHLALDDLHFEIDLKSEHFQSTYTWLQERSRQLECMHAEEKSACQLSASSLSAAQTSCFREYYRPLEDKKQQMQTRKRSRQCREADEREPEGPMWHRVLREPAVEIPKLLSAFDKGGAFHAQLDLWKKRYQKKYQEAAIKWRD